MLPHRTIMIAPIAALLAASGSHAAVHVTSDFTHGFNTVVSTGEYTELPGGEFNASTSHADGDLHYSMTGDLRLEFNPGEPGPVVRRAYYESAQTFQVSGVFPVEMRLSADLNLKAVNSGGPAGVEFGETFATATVAIFETGSYVPGDYTYTGLGSLVADMTAGVFAPPGNGYSILDVIREDDDTYVLTPGVSYTVLTSLAMRTTASGLTPADTSAAAYFEAGGISTFRGVHFSLTTVPVPAPGAAVLIGLGGLACARRRGAPAR